MAEDDPRFVGVDDLGTVPLPDQNGEVSQPFALTLDEFIADKQEGAVPLLGSEQEQIIPVGGLVILAGQGGIGKTTLIVDLVFHAVSGLDFLGIKVTRPLNVVVLENEGPREQFRLKMERKRDAWKATREGEYWIKVQNWASFTLLDDDSHKRLGDFCDRQEIDLVVGDPLGTLGTTGVGSPEDTLGFVQRLRALGLTQTRSFLFNHHLRKEKAGDELDQVQGAWGNHLDSLLMLKPTIRDSEVRLSFPKLRWAAAQRKPLILGKITATQGFESQGEEDSSEHIERQIRDLLEDGKWRTVDEIRKTIQRRTESVKDCLETNEQMFRQTHGELVERKKGITVWSLLDRSAVVAPDDGESGETFQPPDRAKPESGEPHLFALPELDE
jgi:hypothetical protein